MLIGPEIGELTTELAGIIAPEPSRCPALCCELIEHIHHVLAAEPLAHLDRQALSRKDIDHGQGAKPVPIDQLIGDKIQAPGVIRSRDR